MDTSVHGKAVRFDERYLSVELDDGRVISTPLDWYPELQAATAEQRTGWQFICDDTGIEWSELDYHLSIESMLVGSHVEHQHSLAS